MKYVSLIFGLIIVILKVLCYKMNYDFMSNILFVYALYAIIIFYLIQNIIYGKKLKIEAKLLWLLLIFSFPVIALITFLFTKNINSNEV